MLQLHGYLNHTWDAEPIIARITNCQKAINGKDEILITHNPDELYVPSAPILKCPSELHYLLEGDIVRIIPRAGEISILYRINSDHNTIFLTELCNCNCIMCPQPPNKNGNSWVEDWEKAISLMSQNTKVLGISGGEPTMVPDALSRIISTCKHQLPTTGLHILTNGRFFNYLSYCEHISSLNHPELIFGIPLYADLAYAHDNTVQTNGAFDQTIRAILNLARYKQRIEIRIVIMKHNKGRLLHFAHFIARNMPFVEHVAFMALEPLGLARTNFKKIWILPTEYKNELRNAITELSYYGIDTSVYNHPLCLLDESIRKYACKSISDWKQEYPKVCNACLLKNDCGGVFYSSVESYVKYLRPVKETCSVPDSKEGER